MTSHHATTPVRAAGLLAVVGLVVLATPAGVLAAGATPPETPAAYYGQVTVDGEPAPAGVTVTAWVDGDPRGTITTDADGSFGGSGTFDDKLVVRASANDSVEFTAAGLDTGTTVAWESGDHRQLSLSVSDGASPTAAVSAPESAGVGADITFDAGGSSDDGQIVGYEWSFGDGATASGETVVHAFDGPGEYDVTLTVTDAAGNTDVAETQVVVKEAGEGSGGGPPPDTGGRADPSDSTGQPATGTVDVTPTESGVSVELRNLTRNRTVSFDVGENAATDGARLESLAVSMAENASASLHVSALADLPADAETPSRDDAVGYFEVDHDVPDSAIGEVTFEFSVSAAELSESALAPADVTLYRYHDDEWQPLETTLADRSGDRFRYRAVSPGLSMFAIGGPEREPSIAVRSASLDATEATVGDEVSVSATVSNAGTADGEYTATLFVDGEAVAERTVTVPAGESRNVTFDVALDEPGSYEVRVDGEAAGSVSVSEADDGSEDRRQPDGTTTVDEPAAFDPVTVGVVFVVVAVVVGLFVLTRRTS